MAEQELDPTPAEGDSWAPSDPTEVEEIVKGIQAEAPKEPSKPAEETKPAAEAAAPEPKPAPTPQGWMDPETGIEYTPAEMREWRARGLMEQDYRRKTQRLADERRQFEEERRRAIAAPPTPASERPGQDDLEDEEIAEPVRRAIRSRDERYNREITTLRTELDRRDREQRAREFEEGTWSTFGKTFDRLCEEKKVTDPWERDFLQAQILKRDPEFDDFEDLASEVERIFTENHRAYHNRVDANEERINSEVTKRLEALKNAPKGLPSPKGGGTVSPKPPAKEQKGFDVEVTGDEVLQELRSIQAGQ